LKNGDITFGLGVVGAIFGSLLLIGFLVTVGWERPPMDVTQQGYRGLGMEDVTNPRTESMKMAMNAALEAPYDVSPGGTPVSQIRDVYKNVQVLGDLNEDQFNRLMLVITEWVSPDQGCAYCHNEANMASDEKYTKTVSRGMLEMTMALNKDWGDHVKETGVTCYTCHRGNPVPVNVWSTNPGPKQAGGWAANRNGQNMATASNGSTSLPFDPFTNLLAGDGMISVNSMGALPSGSDRNTQDAEQTYGLMMHFSSSLGVNCTHCHNSRAFWDWDQSPPTRLQAQAGIGMVREINSKYIEPLAGILPDDREGSLGDVLKANCATCHQGVNKPLYGAPMAKDYPALSGK
jgi:photosynthetic reaction center cytochrome c subunit